MKHAICLLALLSLFSTFAADTVKIPFLPDEGWWGGAYDLGGDMPIRAGSDYEVDLREGCTFQGNASLFVSDRGRWIWSEDPCLFVFRDGAVTVTPTRGEVSHGKAGDTLKSACDYVSAHFQPPSGKSPAKEFFSQPGYCTWVELGYNQNQEGIERYVRGIRENGFPPGVLVIDDTWQTDYGVWEFDPRAFPDPKGMCDALHRDGFKVLLWACAYVSPDSREYRKLQAEQGVLMAADGSKDFYGNPNAVLCNWWNGWSAAVDFTSPAGRKWATETFQGLCDRYGVDGFKFDGTNPKFFATPNRKAWRADATSADLSHEYGAWSERFGMSSLQTWRNGGRALVVRLVDKGHSWDEQYRVISDMIVAGLIGCPFVLPDMVGGGLLQAFEPGSHFDQDVFVRSAQCQALSPMIQFSVAPWRVLDATHLAAVKRAVETRAKFADLFVRLAENAGRTGEPMLRSLEYVFPRRGYADVKDEFLMGDGLLVVPQVTKGTRRKAVIPPGVWLGDDGSTVNGPAEIEIDVPLDRIPHYIRRD